MASAFCRVAVMILEVHDSPGRISSGGLSSAMTTLKSLASWLETALWLAASPVAIPAARAHSVVIGRRAGVDCMAFPL